MGRFFNPDPHQRGIIGQLEQKIDTSVLSRLFRIGGPMLRKSIYLIIALWLSCMSSVFAAPAQSGGPSPAGTWKTYDLDHTPRSLVRFSVSGNHAQGTIVKVLSPKKGTAPSAVCTACSGANKNRPYVGMTVVSGLTRQADGSWTGGRVLDTDSGSSYRCNVTVSPDGRTLHLHAYVAIPALGKTVDWTRAQ